MKRRITIKRRHASSVRPGLSWFVFTHKGRLCTPSLHQVRFRRNGYFVSLRGAERHAVGVVGIVVVVIAVAVNIVEVVIVVSRPQPPIDGERRIYSA